jgi:hypothetical protein
MTGLGAIHLRKLCTACIQQAACSSPWRCNKRNLLLVTHERNVLHSCHHFFGAFLQLENVLARCPGLQAVNTIEHISGFRTRHASLLQNISILLNQDVSREIVVVVEVLHAMCQLHSCDRSGRTSASHRQKQALEPGNMHASGSLLHGVCTYLMPEALMMFHIKHTRALCGPTHHVGVLSFKNFHIGLYLRQVVFWPLLIWGFVASANGCSCPLHCAVCTDRYGPACGHQQDAGSWEAHSLCGHLISSMPLA